MYDMQKNSHIQSDIVIFVVVLVILIKMVEIHMRSKKT